MPRPHKRVKKEGPPGYVIAAAIVAGGLLLIFGALSLIGGGSKRAAIEVTGQPRIKVDREAVDLGDIALGTPVKTVFALTNVGDQPLRFTPPSYVEVVEGC